MAGGRPKITTKDLPENWKDQMLSMMAKGMSDVEIRASFCIKNGKFSHRIWYALQDRDDEFCETIKIGKVLCQAWWEKQGRENITERCFRDALWYMNMKNRFGWKDNNEINLKAEDAEDYFKTIANAISKSDTTSD